MADPSFDSSDIATGTLISSGYQGEVYLTGSGSQRLIVKRAMGVWPIRMIRQRMLRREYAVYQRLNGIPGVPRCYGLQDGKHLVLEYIESESYREFGKPPGNREQFFASLLEIVQSLHRAGVAHADMKRKNNILIAESGQPYLIDFGSALMRRERSGFLNRFLFEQASRIDLNAWVKLKYRNRFGELSDADSCLYRPTTIEKLARAMRPFWHVITLRRWRKARRSR